MSGDARRGRCRRRMRAEGVRVAVGGCKIGGGEGGDRCGVGRGGRGGGPVHRWMVGALGGCACGRVVVGVSAKSKKLPQVVCTYA